MASLTPHTGLLGKRLAKHLLRRSTFNVSKERIEEYSAYTPAQAIEKLSVIPEKNLKQPIHYVNDELTVPSPWIDDDAVFGPANVNTGSGNGKLRYYVVSWWLDEAKRDTSYRSKMAYFLHTDFTLSSLNLNGQFGSFYDYLRLLEVFCLGDWKEFVFQITKNPQMLNYLNNNQNTVKNPNENYAREILELFTVGKGPQVGVGDYTNYTESDVEEAARVLTGWKYHYINSVKYPDRDRYLVANGSEYGNIPCGYITTRNHDFGRKEFSHRFGNYVIEEWDTNNKTEAQKQARVEAELKEFIEMVLSKDETAKFICRKLYRFFVSRKITTEIENDIIAPLASTFRINYNLKEVIDQLLLSQHFYDLDDSNNTDEIIGGIIKSPIDLVLQTLTITDYPVPDPISHGEHHYDNFYYRQVLLKFLLPASQDPFNPPSVAGFPPNYENPDYDKFWFNSSTIIPRYNLADILLHSNRTKVNFLITKFVEDNVSDPYDASKIVSELVAIMFPEDIDTSRMSYFLNDILLEGGETTQQMWADEWNAYKNSGNNAGVESVLKPFFRALLWSQEFQNN